MQNGKKSIVMNQVMRHPKKLTTKEHKRFSEVRNKKPLKITTMNDRSSAKITLHYF